MILMQGKGVSKDVARRILNNLMGVAAVLSSDGQGIGLFRSEFLYLAPSNYPTEVDFFSVGINDLTQYTLACDRQANDLGKFFDPHHPAVLRALKMATDAAHKAGI